MYGFQHSRLEGLGVEDFGEFREFRVWEFQVQGFRMFTVSWFKCSVM